MISSRQISIVIFFAFLAILILSIFRINSEPTTSPKTVTINNSLPSPTLNLSVTHSGTKAIDEYLKLSTYPKTKVSNLITDWKIINARGNSISIGKASNLPMFGVINTEQPILMPQSSTLIISSARSPLGVSFRVNSCSGYFAQYYDLNPELSTTCPDPLDILTPEEKMSLDTECLSFVRSMPLCHNPINNPELKLQSQYCQDVLISKLNYNSCVMRMSATDNFYKNEWRLFLNKEKQIWPRSVDVISLFDFEGRVITSTSY